MLRKYPHSSFSPWRWTQNNKKESPESSFLAAEWRGGREREGGGRKKEKQQPPGEAIQPTPREGRIKLKPKKAHEHFLFKMLATNTGAPRGLIMGN